MAKSKKKEILKKIKDKKEESKRRNITFRIKSQLLETFKEDCEENGVTMTDIIESYMEDFLK